MTEHELVEKIREECVQYGGCDITKAVQMCRQHDLQVARESVQWIKPEFADHKESLIFKSKALDAINKAFRVSDEEA